MFNLGIESVKRYNECAYYGPIWFVEFRDFTTAVVLYNGEREWGPNSPIEGNFVMEEEPLFQGKGRNAQ